MSADLDRVAAEVRAIRSRLRGVCGELAAVGTPIPPRLTLALGTAERLVEYLDPPSTYPAHDRRPSSVQP
jgi:hypothetical protein